MGCQHVRIGDTHAIVCEPTQRCKCGRRATPQERATILANTLHKSKFLEETYTPPTLELARKMAEKRQAGRAPLAGYGRRQRRAGARVRRDCRAQSAERPTTTQRGR